MIVGILGGGQLARMLALAGTPLGLNFRFLDPQPDACAFPLGEALVGPFDDPSSLQNLARNARVVTYEFENVHVGGVEHLARQVPLLPPPRALAVKQDRLREKQLFVELGLPTARFRPVQTERDLREAAQAFGFPLVLKTRSLGYDGKGQRIVRGEEEMDGALAPFGGSPLLAEEYVPFDREVSVVAVRGTSGTIACYPLVENVHHQGILHRSRPRPDDPFAASAAEYAQRLLTHFDYVGVLAVEFFQVGARLLANEYAPRVHNTGHWTLEGAETSQFENHLRAILGFPLGATSAVRPVVMINCIGGLPDRARLLEIPGAHLHAYGKPPRPGRKVGHVTLRATDERDLEEKLEKVKRVFTDSGLWPSASPPPR
jgi:5-(carboxyamino)imidazole ribonucleotide synthase